MSAWNDRSLYASAIERLTRSYRVERLPNGFVRVDCPSGLVHVWHKVNGNVCLRSGNGFSGYPVGVHTHIESLFGI